MICFLIVLLWIAPFVSVTSSDQQKPDSSIKPGAVQEHTSRNQQSPEEIQAREKPKQATEGSHYESPMQVPPGQAEKQETYDPRKDTLYRAYLWATICGVVVALCVLGFIARQNWHIQRQTASLERQLNIQQRSSRQWLNILDWRQHDAKGNMTFGIYFKIENPTKVPLHLDHVKCSVRGQREHSMLGTFLAPDNPFPHEFYVSLDITEWTSYSIGSGVVLEVEVSVFFTDAFDNHWNQIFQRTLFCQGHDNTLHVRESRTIMRRSADSRTRRSDQNEREN